MLNRRKAIYGDIMEKYIIKMNKRFANTIESIAVDCGITEAIVMERAIYFLKVVTEEIKQDRRIFSESMSDRRYRKELVF